RQRSRNRTGRLLRLRTGHAAHSGTATGHRRGDLRPAPLRGGGVAGTLKSRRKNWMAEPHRVVIIGGGFGGLRAAYALRDAPVDITLIDRRNFHLFQPLLYQVAAGALSPANIAAPIRGLF